MAALKELHALLQAKKKRTLLHYCFTTALLLLDLLLLYCRVRVLARAPRLGSALLRVLRLHYYYFATALLLLDYCFTTALLLARAPRLGSALLRVLKFTTALLLRQSVEP